MAVDVLEHFDDPVSFLSTLCELVNPKGLLIFSTGNPSASIWCDHYKSHFWYSSYAEHVTFPSPKFAGIWARNRGLRVLQLHEFRYSQNSVLKCIGQFVLQASYLHALPIHRFLHRVISSGRRSNTGPDSSVTAGLPTLPCSGLFQDHYVVILQKL